jgi:hypothetical protein
VHRHRSRRAQVPRQGLQSVLHAVAVSLGRPHCVLAHLGGGDTRSSAALGPKLQQFDVYTATLTAPSEIVRSLIESSAYSSYRNDVEQKLFGQSQQHEGALGIAGFVASGLGPYAASADFIEVMKTAGVPHLYDSHPPLAERMRNVSHAVPCRKASTAPSSPSCHRSLGPMTSQKQAISSNACELPANSALQRAMITVCGIGKQKPQLDATVGRFGSATRSCERSSGTGHCCNLVSMRVTGQAHRLCDHTRTRRLVTPRTHRRSSGRHRSRMRLQDRQGRPPCRRSRPHGRGGRAP